MDTFNSFFVRLLYLSRFVAIFIACLVLPHPLFHQKFKFQMISADTGSVFAAITEDGGLLVWGSTRHGFTETPKLYAKKGFTFCCAGDGYVLAIDSDGRMWELLSSGKSSPAEMRLVEFGQNGHICTKVDACGKNALVVVELPDGVDLFTRNAQTRGKFVKIPELSEAANGSAARLVSAGSNHCAVVVGNTPETQQIFTWGQNRSGNLGLGHRKDVDRPVEVANITQMLKSQMSDLQEGGTFIVSISCTRGQPNPKNNFPDPTGQEGPRTHVVTQSGHLFISGACHKGLGANHIFKVMNPSADHLEFYLVGTARAKEKRPGCLTGALESVQRTVSSSEKDVSSSSTSVVCAGSLDCGGFYMSKDDRASSFRKYAEAKGGSPTQYLSGVRVLATADASIHSFALADDGTLYGWGCGSDGRLGLSHFFNPNGTKRLMKCYVSTPTPVQFEGSKAQSVLSAAVGRHWSFAIAM
jgi:alpha-tubulin suppressor-like RCC1 family protein